MLRWLSNLGRCLLSVGQTLAAGAALWLSLMVSVIVIAAACSAAAFAMVWVAVAVAFLLAAPPWAVLGGVSLVGMVISVSIARGSR